MIEDLSIRYNDKCDIRVFSGKANRIKINYIKIFLAELVLNIKWYLFAGKTIQTLYTFNSQLRKAQLMLNSGIPHNAVLYSYWADSSALLISILKSCNIRNLAITRLHGFDLYIEGNNLGHIPFRSFVFQNINFLAPISVNGEVYLKKKYPILNSDRIKKNNLGIKQLANPTNKWDFNNSLKIVSCSWVGNHKNLKEIFKLLKNQEDWTWSHIGDGEDFDDLKEFVSKPSKLVVNLLGKFSQDQIRAYYATEPITCFISLSPNEGLPVSMMEAMAFGIPVVSTDVGGCAEIVTPETGVLLPKNYTHEDVVNAVNFCAEKFSSPEARKRIQDFIKANFDAEKNYRKFIDFLEEENNKHLALHS